MTPLEVGELVVVYDDVATGGDLIPAGTWGVVATVNGNSCSVRLEGHPRVRKNYYRSNSHYIRRPTTIGELLLALDKVKVLEGILHETT